MRHRPASVALPVAALAVAVRERAAAGASSPSDAQLADAYEDAIVTTIAGCLRKLLRARGPSSGHASARGRVALEAVMSRFTESANPRRKKDARTSSPDATVHVIGASPE